MTHESPRQLLERAVHDRGEIERLFHAHGAAHDRPQTRAPLHFDDLVLALRGNPDALALHLAAALDPAAPDAPGVRRTPAGFAFGRSVGGAFASEKTTPDASVAVAYWLLHRLTHVTAAAIPQEPPPFTPTPRPPALASTVPCPLCGEYGVLQFVKPAGLPVALECDECGQLFADREAALAHRAFTLPAGVLCPPATLAEVLASPLAPFAAGLPTT